MLNCVFVAPYCVYSVDIVHMDMLLVGPMCIVELLWYAPMVCMLQRYVCSNGVLFLLQNFNITMAVGQGSSYWNKAMKKPCMYILSCTGCVIYAQGDLAFGQIAWSHI